MLDRSTFAYIRTPLPGGNTDLEKVFLSWMGYRQSELLAGIQGGLKQA
jgi:hypothetical protein